MPRTATKVVKGTLNLVVFYYLYTTIYLSTGTYHTVFETNCYLNIVFQQLKRVDNRWVRPSEDTKGGNEEKAKTQVSYQHYIQPSNYVHTILCLKPGT